MAIQTPPPQKQKKSGLGCFGCGCLIVIVILLLVAGLVGGVCYFAYRSAYNATSAEPAAIPAFSGGDDVYAGAEKKLDAFNQSVTTGQAATLTLSSDELNALIAHDPTLAKKKVHLLVTLTGEEARLQGSVPTSDFPFGLMPNRYLNFDATFGLTFNSDTKHVGTSMHKLQVGDSELPDNALPTVDAELMPWIEILIDQSPAAKHAVQAASTIQIKDGQFVVVTK
jgi:hypothetical protein